MLIKFLTLNGCRGEINVERNNTVGEVIDKITYEINLLTCKLPIKRPVTPENIRVMLRNTHLSEAQFKDLKLLESFNVMSDSQLHVLFRRGPQLPSVTEENAIQLHNAGKRRTRKHSRSSRKTRRHRSKK
jgi:hypothetical protein